MMTGKPSALRYAKRSYAHFLVSIIVELIGDLGSMHRMNNRSAVLRLAKEIDFFYSKPTFLFFQEYRVFSSHVQPAFY